MNRKGDIPLTVLFLCLTLIAAPAFAMDTAPLPDGFATETTTTVRGVFANAVEYENPFDLEDSLRAAEKACIARGRKLDSVWNTRHQPGTSYWLYRSGNETVVFSMRVSARIEVELCRVTFEEKREILRSTVKAGEWPSPFLGGRLKCSGFAKTCYSATMFGIKARCRAEGNGFQGTRDCVSIGRGPSRGMLLESVYESDDMTGSGFRVSELKADALINASLFDQSRNW